MYNTKTELYLAQMAIVRLMPDDIRDLLLDYMSCKTRRETGLWEIRVFETIIDYAEPLEGTSKGSFNDRALCPLCRESGRSFYEEGFALPEGLKRHLTGYGNMRQCVVTKAAFNLAHDSWEGKFRKKEEEKRAKERAILEERKLSETLYLTHANGNPRLIDEIDSFYETARDPEQLIWAEKRLKNLGFHKTIEGKIISYKKDFEDWCVFADPRISTKIVFHIYKKSGKERYSKKYYPQFFIKDNWVNDINGKFEKRVKKAVSI